MDWIFFFFGGVVVGMLAAEVALKRKTGNGIQYYLEAFRKTDKVVQKRGTET